MSTSGPVPIRIFIVILLASLAAFFGCGGGESSPTAAPTATPIVSPAATGTATPLATATPVHTVSPSPSPTTSPTPTASPTSSPTPTPESGSTATLSTPEGEVLTQEQGSEDWQDAASGTKLSAGDIIRTGEDGYALLIFLDGSVLEVEANSEIRIEELSSDADTGSTTVRLWQTVGKTVSRVGQLVDPASRYEVETPAASAVVRGTIFDLQVLLSGLTTIWSQQGNIAFGGGNVTVTVGAGTRSSCSIGGTPSTPVSYLGGGGSGGSHPELEVSCAADPQSAEVGHDIQFDCTASGGYPDYAYAWDFGDGQGSEERKPTYAYAAAGNYTPCVTVADSRNNSEECCTEISVFPALSLDCSAAPNPTKVGHEVDFTCSPTGGVTPYTFLWQFGDGGTSDLQNPSHTYASAGNRHVCITVTDSLDNVEDCCFDITVNPPLNIQDCSAAPNPTKVGHQVDFTCSPTGGVTPYTFLWNFGDGNTSDLQNPSYTYASAGDRHPCITVTDDLGNVDDCCFDITVNPPLNIQDCSAAPNPTKVGHQVDFTCSPTGGVTPYTFLWNFGNGGTSDLQNPSYSYASAGDRHVCITVTDDLGNVGACCFDITVNPPLHVDDCSAVPNPTKVGHEVDFTCSPTGGVAPYTFLWDFGDGNTSDLQNPSYSYGSAGDRNVCTTVTDDLGNVEDCCFDITVNPPLGIDDCRATPNPTKVGHEVDFTCSPTGGVTPYTFLWDFGDGNTSDQQNPSYAYLSAGNYTACVRVDDALQNVEVCCVDIAVNPQPLVDITSPQDGSTLYEKLLYIEGVVQSAYEIQEARVTHNGQSRGLELVPEGSNGYLYTFNTPLELFQGWNQIAVTAIDSEGQSGNDSVLVYGELPICAIRIELSWTSDNTDFDSHLLRPGGIYNQVPDDCCYFNRNPDWDGTGSSTPGDPALDVDDTDGYGPEYIVLCDPPYDGIYEYKVHYFSDHGYGPDTASVKIWIRDELAFEDTRVLSDGELWDCAHIEWPSGDVFAELPD